MRWISTRRRFQFSLASLLISMLLVASFFASFGVLYHRALLEEQAATTFRELGGTVEVNAAKGRLVTYDWLQHILPSYHFVDVVAIDLAETQVTDAHLIHVRHTPKVKTLVLSDTPVTDSGLVFLRHTRLVEELVVDGTDISNEGMKNLTGMIHLRVLDLARCNIDDDGLRNLEGLVALEEVWLTRTFVTQRGLQNLGEHLSDTRIVAAGLND